MKPFTEISKITSSAKAIYLSMLRTGSFRTVILTIAIPLAVMAIFLSTGALVNEEFSNVVAGYGRHIESRVCFQAEVIPAHISSKNLSSSLSLDVPIYLINESSLATLTNHAVSGNFISLGQGLARELHVKEGDILSLCSEGICIEGRVSHVRRANGPLSYVAMTNINAFPASSSESREEICKEEALPEIEQSISSNVMEVLSLLAAMSIASYILLICIAQKGFSMHLEREISVLRDAGLSLRETKLSLLLVSSSSSFLFSLYGISMGVLAFHFGIWLLRFLGIILPKPLPPLLPLLEASILVSILSGLLSYKSLGE